MVVSGSTKVELLRIKTYTDTDYSNDKVDRQSVYHDQRQRRILRIKEAGAERPEHDGVRVRGHGSARHHVASRSV
jgi:hypothetical protein